MKVGSIDHSETIVQFIYLDSHQPFKEVRPHILVSEIR